MTPPPPTHDAEGNAEALGIFVRAVMMPPSAMHKTLEIHQYDGQHPKAVYEFTRATAPSAPTIAETIADAKAHLDQQPDASLEIHKAMIAKGIDHFHTSVDDPANGNVNTCDAFRVAWALCKNAGEQELLITAVTDMVRSHGYCVPGRTSRMLQIIGALMPQSP